MWLQCDIAETSRSELAQEKALPVLINFKKSILVSHSKPCQNLFRSNFCIRFSNSCSAPIGVRGSNNRTTKFLSGPVRDTLKFCFEKRLKKSKNFAIFESKFLGTEERYSNHLVPVVTCVLRSIQNYNRIAASIPTFLTGGRETLTNFGRKNSQISTIFGNIF